jgi:hypothetical protein
MNDISDDDLIDFLLGRAAPSRAKEIMEEVDKDPALATQLDIMSRLSGLPLLALDERRAAASALASRQRRRYRLFAIMVVVLALSGIGWTAWQVFRPRPLLEDNFNDGWVDVRLWRTGRRGIHEENGYLKLMNRGSIVTQQEFRVPIEITFKWRWIDHAGDPLYAENLNIALRTSGRHDEKHPYDILDGFIVTLHGMGGCVKMIHPFEPSSETSAVGGVPFPPNEWHDVRITDDGDTISVYLKGPAIDPKYAREPVLVGHRKQVPKGYRIAVYNRELVAKATHESHIDDFRVDVLPIASEAP